MAMAVKVSKKKSKKTRIPQDITLEPSIRPVGNSDVMTVDQNFETNTPTSSELDNNSRENAGSNVVNISHDTSNSQKEPPFISPSIEKCVIPQVNDQKYDTTLNETSSIMLSGENVDKDFCKQDFDFEDRKPITNSEVRNISSKRMVSDLQKQDDLLNRSEYLFEQSNFDVSSPGQHEDRNRCLEYSKLSASVLSLHENLKTFNEHEYQLEDKYKSMNVILVEQEEIMAVAPTAPPLIKCKSMYKIRSLDETSLCSLYPLQTHSFNIPSDPVIRNHQLFGLLTDYLCACNHLESYLLKHESLISTAENHRKLVWTLTEEQVVQLGKCKDLVQVAATYLKTTAVIDDMHLLQLGNCLSALRENLHSECAFYLFDAETHYLRVELFLQALEEAQALSPSRVELDTCICILFSFVRRQDLNSGFISKVQVWLLRLGKALLRVALPNDRLLLLSQILHCPKGISNWAMPLIQFEPPPQLFTFATAVCCRPELEVVVEALSLIMNSPALKQIEKESRKCMIEEVWVMLDVDGEEEDLFVPGDEDLCKILDCVPLKAAVIHVLGLVGEEFPSSITAVDLLKFFSLSTSLLKILGVGLLQSRLQRFPSFCKRVTSMVQHMIHLISDTWELSTSLNCIDHDLAMQARLGVEFDSLFMKVTGYFFHCVIRSHGWKNLTELPFRLLSLEARWNILKFFLNFEDKRWFDGIENPSQDTKEWLLEIKGSADSFGNLINKMADEEASLILITLKNLAITCEDSAFAEAVAYDIFMVGNLTPLAEERDFSVAAYAHLASILTKHPCLFSNLIDWLKEIPHEVEKSIPKLFLTLPLQKWEPSAHDLSTLSAWILQNDPQTVKNSLARNILLRISWRENCIGDPLPLDVCYAAATLALNACLTWDSRSKMSQLATSVIWPKSTISSWAWSLVGLLPIHPYDRRKDASTFYQHHANLKSALLAALNLGFQENYPLSFLLAVLGTEIGHNSINAEKDAFSHLSVVAAHGKYTEVISALYLILPLFIDNVDKLISCKSFEKLFQTLLFADYTYIQMATNLIASNFPGVILTELGNMMVSHLEESHKFGSTLTSFVFLWLNCIFLTPIWMHKKEAIYLVDLIIRSALLDENDKAWDEAICLLKKHKELYTPVGETALSSSISTLFTMLSMEPSLGSPHPQSLAVRSSLPEFPWFFLAALEVEEEGESILWNRIQMDLGSLPCKIGVNSITLNNALKNACQKSDIQPFPATCLSIFRWARQATDTSIEHPVFPLLWAHFFSLYKEIFSSCTAGISSIFTGHSSWTNFFILMKKKLNESYKWYYKEAVSDVDDHELMLWLKHCARLFGAFVNWLEEKQQSVPPSNASGHYDPDRLYRSLLYSGRRTWRNDYIYTVGVRRNISSNLNAWETLRRSCSQTVIEENFLHSSTLSHPLQRIYDRIRLCSDTPSIHFPPLIDIPVRFEHTNPASSKQVSSKTIRACILPLLQSARVYSLYNSEHTALDCSLLELLPQLYEDCNVKFTQVVHCKPLLSDVDGITSSVCNSPAMITFKVKDSQVCERVKTQIDGNLVERNRLINSVLHEAPHEACTAGIALESIIKSLILDKKSISQIPKLQETALVLLNALIDMFSEDSISQYPPTKKLVNSCVEILGQEFVFGEESQLLPLLLKMIERPQLVGILAPLLSPSSVSNGAFLQAYDVLIRHLNNMDENVAFVLLSKFDIGHWLTKDDHTNMEQIDLLHLIISGLSSSSILKDNEPTVITGLLQGHLRKLLINNAPELLLKVIEFLLKASGDHCLQTFVWFDVFDAIISLENGNLRSLKPVLRADISPEQITIILKEFATRQRIISFDQVKNIVNFLGDYFHDERLHFGLHGLYPKYRSHIQAIQVLIELLGHLLIAGRNVEEIGLVTSFNFVAYLWPSLCNLFGPWLLPYWEDQLKEEGAHWILELMDGHPPLTPWIPSDSAYAFTIALSFCRCISFCLDVLPGHSNILSLVWEIYYSSIAQIGVGCHILDIIHDAFTKLPWKQFWPSLQNLRGMIDVMQRVPECHVFIFYITTHIRWKEWIGSLAPSNSLCSEALNSLLNLILSLSCDLNLKKVNYTDLHPLLIDAKDFPWHNLRASDYVLLLDLFRKYTKPEIVFGWSDSKKTEDVSLLLLLQCIAGICDPQQEEGLPPRAIPFYCAISKLLFDAIEGVEQDEIVVDVLVKIIKELEAAVRKGFSHRGNGKQMLEMADAIKLVFIPHLSANSLKFTEAFCKALSTKSFSSYVQSNTLCSKGLLYALNSSNLTQSQLHLLVECALEVLLIDEQDVFPLLDFIPTLLNFQGDNMVIVADALSSSGHLLTLSACLRKASFLLPSDPSTSQSIENPLNLLVNRWLPALTLTENIESKIPLLWAHALLFAQSSQSREMAGALEEGLQILATSLINIGSSQEGFVNSFLGSIGLKKRLSPSIRFKIFCTTVAAFLFAYLEGKEVHGSRLKDAQSSVEKICKQNREFGEVATIFNSTVMKPNLSLKHGNELIEKLLGRLYFETRCYIQCVY